jgi:hypothetical protein
MKKILFLCFFIAISYISDAQLVLSGHPNSDVNGNYLYIDNLSHTLPDGTITDAGADYYRKTIVNNVISGYYQIYRKNNFWYISIYFSYSLNNAFYSQTTPISTFQYFTTSNNPPCEAFWSYSYGNGAYGTGADHTLTITGISCFQPTYTGGLVVNPTNIQFPQLSTAAFNSIVPIKGMVTFFADENALKVYDGGQWRMLHGSLNDIILNDSSTVKFGNYYKISSIQSNLKSLTADWLTVNNTSTFSKSVHLPVTIHTGSNNLTLTDAMQIVVLNSTGTTARTFTLPAPNTAKGRIYELQNYTTSANLLIGGYTVQTNGSGGTTSTILPGAGIRIFSDGTTWRKFN